MLPNPSTIAPLDPEEFLAAHDYAGMVMENEFLEEVPGIGKPFIRTPDGMLGFSNEPVNLFAMAVLRHFRGQPDKFKAFMARFWALGRLLDRDEIKSYARGTRDDLELHHAVFEVVATQKLSDNYEFDPELFFRTVREVAARMDSEEAGNS
jgi:hypothetical protein